MFDLKSNRYVYLYPLEAVGRGGEMQLKLYKNLGWRSKE